MEERHKRILQRNRVNLVRDLNPSDMYHGLLSKGIFTQDMIDEIKSSGIRQGQARQLVRDLETRGSLAFPALIECLHETGQHSLAELLLDGEPQNQPLPQPVHVRPVVRPLPVYSPMDTVKPAQVPLKGSLENPGQQEELDVTVFRYTMKFQNTRPTASTNRCLVPLTFYANFSTSKPCPARDQSCHDNTVFHSQEIVSSCALLKQFQFSLSMFIWICDQRVPRL
ncbi:caspase-9-like isoform X3 [Oncorhynchus kisutch]|uniref:caspase-9-like isoform X3 n=1 Tax=Oncorhynchus kisutch TaxID=8019 RepID=UPI0012DE7750|nr:caspase-9-like isoform X3 [Oncorhynchus kisutch]